MTRGKIRPWTGRGGHRHPGRRSKNFISDVIRAMLAERPNCARCHCGLDEKSARLAFPSQLCCDRCYPELHAPPEDHDEYVRVRRIEHKRLIARLGSRLQRTF